jgi:hypothetical protein
MMDRFSAGSVWWGLVDFNKGQVKKYFVLLSDCPASGEQALVAMTTSKVTRYPGQAGVPSPCGCPEHSCFRIDAGQEACFPLTTWIQFDNEDRNKGRPMISRSSLEQLEKEGRGGFLQHLAADRFRAILNCAKKSLDVEQWALKIIDKTANALNPVKRAQAQIRSAALPVGKLSAPPPPPPVNAAIAKVGAQYKQRCSVCRLDVVGLLLMTETQVEAVLSGSKPPPDRFVSEAEEALQMVRPECTCLSAPPGR